MNHSRWRNVTYAVILVEKTQNFCEWMSKELATLWAQLRDREFQRSESPHRDTLCSSDIPVDYRAGDDVQRRNAALSV